METLQNTVAPDLWPCIKCTEMAEQVPLIGSEITPLGLHSAQELEMMLLPASLWKCFRSLPRAASAQAPRGVYYCPHLSVYIPREWMPRENNSPACTPVLSGWSLQIVHCFFTRPYCPLSLEVAPRVFLVLELLLS